MPRDLADYFVLDALADDIESLEQILPSVTHSATFWQIDEEPVSFGRDRVVTSILRLIKEHSVVALSLDSSGQELATIGEGVMPSGRLDDYWFGLTAHGRILHSAWSPPPERAPS